MITKKENEVLTNVREFYKEVSEKSGCGCGLGNNLDITDISIGMGYSEEDLASIPDTSNMGLGCGNPKAIAELKQGETVLDLGSGGGLDCFIASPLVGETGKVIGVDMTPEMVGKSRSNSEKGGYTNVEFRLGEIENLPVADNSIDVVISNCVINLSPNKQRVFDEVYRVLKLGGRMAFTDIVALIEVPAEIQQNKELYSGCMGGATVIDKLKIMLEKSGFDNVSIDPQEKSKKFISKWSEIENLTDILVSAHITAVKS